MQKNVECNLLKVAKLKYTLVFMLACLHVGLNLIVIQECLFLQVKCQYKGMAVCVNIVR